MSKYIYIYKKQSKYIYLGVKTPKKVITHKVLIKYSFAQMLYFFAISWPNYGGEDGLSIYMRNSLPMINTMDPLTFYFICLCWLLIVIFISAKLINFFR